MTSSTESTSRHWVSRISKSGCYLSRAQQRICTSYVPLPLDASSRPHSSYFILWLREYTVRYNAWMSSLKSLKRTPSHLSANHPSYRKHEDGLAFNHPHPHSPRPHRPGAHPFASLTVAMSTLSLSVPAPEGSHSTPSSPLARRASHAAIHPPPEEEDVLDELPSERQLRPYAPSPPPLPPPNPSLALFYLRAKETFLAPNAPYELDVGSEVLGGFFIGSSENTKYRKEDDASPYGPLRNLSSLNLSSKAGLGGKLPPPPDPAVFAELKEIVEDRLKASLARLVVATYHNVGMSRAYCGNAGGVVIGTVTRYVCMVPLSNSCWLTRGSFPQCTTANSILFIRCFALVPPSRAAGHVDRPDHLYQRMLWCKCFIHLLSHFLLFDCVDPPLTLFFPTIRSA